jgi:hypothetical protein
MTYTHEYLHHVYNTAVQKVVGKTRNSLYGELDEIGPLVGMEADDLQELLDFVLEMTHTQITVAIERNHIEEDDFNEIMNMGVGNAAATVLILLHALGETPKTTKVADEKDRYPVTLLAEARVRNHIADRADLNKIWPVPLAEEVVSEFDPIHAFMVGVVCGSHNG